MKHMFNILLLYTTKAMMFYEFYVSKCIRKSVENKRILYIHVHCKLSIVNEVHDSKIDMMQQWHKQVIYSLQSHNIPPL